MGIFHISVRRAEKVATVAAMLVIGGEHVHHGNLVGWPIAEQDHSGQNDSGPRFRRRGPAARTIPLMGAIAAGVRTLRSACGCTLRSQGVRLTQSNRDHKLTPVR